MDTYGQIRQTAVDFIDSYRQERCGEDIKVLSSTLTPDCRRYFAPAAITAHVPQLADGNSNLEYEARMQHETVDIFASWTVELLDLTVDEKAKKAAVHAVTHNTAKSGKTYSFEFYFTLFMTDDGTRVNKVNQFVDLSAAQEFIKDHPVKS